MIISSPYIQNQHKRKISRIMVLVCIGTLPGIAVQLFFFGWGTIFQILLGCASALVTEGLVLKLRKMKVSNILRDKSALLIGWLLAISIPPLALWWIVVLGTAFAVIFAKQLYGGIGNNIFNPAMIGYVVLLISFPVHMTNWLPPHKISATLLDFMDTLQFILTGCSSSSTYIGIDGISQATPLDTFKHSLNSEYNLDPMIKMSWQLVNIAYLLGGIFLLYQRVIRWHIPVSFLVTLAILSTIGWKVSPYLLAAPQIHIFYGATMIGAFFILTDPVTSSTTNLGRLIFGSLAGLLVWLIRSFGGYPDGVSFAVLLANITVPLIDYYTRPR